MQPEPVAKAVRNLPRRHFWLGALAGDAAHYLRASGNGNNIQELRHQCLSYVSFGDGKLLPILC